MTKKDDCVFWLADSNMLHTFNGFLEKKDFHKSLGTRPFTFFTKADTQGNDPGVYARAHEYLRPYSRTYEHAVVALDSEWSRAPSAKKIRQDITHNLIRNGWSEEKVEVVVIEPELEIWLWKDGLYLETIIKKKFEREINYKPYPSLRAWLEAQGLWRSADLKPARPKEALERVARTWNIPLLSGDIYRTIAQQVSVRKCADPAFCLLRETLQRWFPA